jgi:hypothetical protein
VKSLLPWKATSFTYFCVCVCMCARAFVVPGHGVCMCVCVHVVLLMHDATHVSYCIVLFVASMTPLNFLTFSYKRHDFGEKVTEHKMCVLISSTT